LLQKRNCEDIQRTKQSIYHRWEFFSVLTRKSRFSWKIVINRDMERDFTFLRVRLRQMEPQEPHGNGATLKDISADKTCRLIKWSKVLGIRHDCAREELQQDNWHPRKRILEKISQLRNTTAVQGNGPCDSKTNGNDLTEKIGYWVAGKKWSYISLLQPKNIESAWVCSSDFNEKVLIIRYTIYSLIRQKVLSSHDTQSTGTYKDVEKPTFDHRRQFKLKGERVIQKA